MIAAPAVSFAAKAGNVARGIPPVDALARSEL